VSGDTPLAAVPIDNAVELQVQYQTGLGLAEWLWYLVPDEVPDYGYMGRVHDAVHTFEAGSILPVRVGASTLRPGDSVLVRTVARTPFIEERSLSSIRDEALRGTPAPGGTYAVPDVCCPVVEFGIAESARTKRTYFPWPIATYRDDMDTRGGYISEEDQDTFLTMASRWLEILDEAFGLIGHAPFGRRRPSYDRPEYFLPLDGTLGIGNTWRTQARRRGTP
jgi:hypothetical protein